MQKRSHLCGRFLLLYTRSASLWFLLASGRFGTGGFPHLVAYGRRPSLTAIGALVDFGGRGFTKLRVRLGCSQSQQVGLLAWYHGMLCHPRTH